MSVVTTDIIFLLHNIRLLKKGGTLGIIVPDGFVTGKNFQVLRQSLLSNHRVEAVIQLPDNSFQGIEVRTHMVILRKGMVPSESVKILQAGADCINGELEINASALEQRMDYSYWYWKLIATNTNFLTLAEIGADIQRGTKPRTFFEDSRINCFHTNQLPVDARQINFQRSKFQGFRMAASHDILTARVGKRCLGRVTLVNKGNLPIADCIYRVRVPKHLVHQVWLSLISDSARDWFSAHSHGVCAQVISKSDLLKFPVGYHWKN